MSERNIQTDNLASSSPPSLLERDTPIRSVIRSLMLSSMLVSLSYVLFVIIKVHTNVQDPFARVACETAAKTGMIMVSSPYLFIAVSS
jgi:hypothetical protein